MTSETRRAGVGVQQIPATFRQGSGARAAAIARAVLCGGHIPIGMLVDSSGKRIGTLPHVFGWMFFDAVIAAASASGVEVRRVDRLKA